MIFEAFPPSDLVFHARFSQLSKRIAQVYGADRDFWKKLCRSNGIGRLQHEDEEKMDWKALALECEMHARSCRHPSCGIARLVENCELKSFSR